MTPRLVRSIDVTPQRWRNGGGLTRELWAWPSSADWQVRVSDAEIAVDGPFSAFAGTARWFSVLQGAGVELTVGNVHHRLERGHAPLCFAGDAATACRLIDGPTRDLNLMLRGATGTMDIAVDGLAWSPAAAQCGLFSAVAGRCRSGALDVDVPAYALLWFETAPLSLTFVADQRPAALIGWWLAATPGREHR